MPLALLPTLMKTAKNSRMVFSVPEIINVDCHIRKLAIAKIFNNGNLELFQYFVHLKIYLLLTLLDRIKKEDFRDEKKRKGKCSFLFTF